MRRAYLHPENRLRASIVADPAFGRKNTKDNTPSVMHVEMVPGDHVDVTVAAKGGGSREQVQVRDDQPVSDSIVDWVLETLPQMGAGWCPPGMLGIGIGGTAEQAMMLAKESLMGDIDMAELKQRGPQNDIEALRIELLRQGQRARHRRAGAGRPRHRARRQDRDWPTHAASKPIAMIPNCAATRHAHFHLDGSGPAYLETPKLDEWPQVEWTPIEGSDPRRSRHADARKSCRAGSRATACCSTARC